MPVVLESRRHYTFREQGVTRKLTRISSESKQIEVWTVLLSWKKKAFKVVQFRLSLSKKT